MPEKERRAGFRMTAHYPKSNWLFHAAHLLTECSLSGGRTYLFWIFTAVP
jgi:hypothetical protein